MIFCKKKRPSIVRMKVLWIVYIYTFLQFFETVNMKCKPIFYFPGMGGVPIKTRTPGQYQFHKWIWYYRSGSCSAKKQDSLMLNNIAIRHLFPLWVFYLDGDSDFPIPSNLTFKMSVGFYKNVTQSTTVWTSFYVFHMFFSSIYSKLRTFKSKPIVSFSGMGFPVKIVTR